MDRISITEAEILSALRAAADTPDGDDGALTMRQMMELTGWGDRKVREHVRRMIASGAAEPVRVPRPTLAGNVQPTPAYRLTRKAAALKVA